MLTSAFAGCVVFRGRDVWLCRGLRFRERSSGCGERALPLVAVCRLLIAVAPLVWSRDSAVSSDVSSCGTWAGLLWIPQTAEHRLSRGGARA